MEKVKKTAPVSWEELMSGKDDFSISELLNEANRTESIATTVEWNEAMREPVIVIGHPDIPSENVHLSLREAAMLRDQLCETLDALNRLRARLQGESSETVDK
jgi:hypothetical protein